MSMSVERDGSRSLSASTFEEVLRLRTGARAGATDSDDSRLPMTPPSRGGTASTGVAESRLTRTTRLDLVAKGPPDGESSIGPPREGINRDDRQIAIRATPCL